MKADGVRLKPRSKLAALAARYMRAHTLALVLGRTIHLHNISEADFWADAALVRHEMKHVEQYKRLGMLRFLGLYLWYSCQYGYYNNPLEKEAREAEQA